MARNLTADERRKLDASDDARFYRQPRFVHHVDEPFRERLIELYHEHLPSGGAILDLMSSHVSHLPEEMGFDRVVGHGMNERELAANPRLDEYFLQNLNREQRLSFPSEAFDAVTIAVSAQYLQYPEAVFAEVGRVLRPGGPVIVSFSNRMFPTKAIRAWRTASMDGRAALVKRYLTAAGGFGTPEVIRARPGSDPFYAVIARRVADR